MRLVLISDVDPANEASGAERLLAEHARGLADRGHQVHLVLGVSRASSPGGNGRLVIYRFDRSLRHPLGGVAPLRRITAAGPVDAVVVYQPFSALGLLGAPAARRAPQVYVFLSPWHQEYQARRPVPPRWGRADAGVWLRRWFEKKLLRRSACVVTLSRHMADILRALHGEPPGGTRIIPGGVDAARFSPPADRTAVRKALGLPADRRILLALRNLEPGMGWEDLLAIMRDLGRGHPDVSLVIGGGGPLGPALRQQAAALGLGDVVRFAGFVPEADLPAYYQAADAFLVPARDVDGFSLVTAEALACGTPVLGAPSGSTTEILEGLDPGLLAADRSAAALGARVDEFLRAGPVPEALRARCRRYAVEHYAWPRVVERLEGVLAEVAAMRSRRGLR